MTSAPNEPAQDVSVAWPNNLLLNQAKSRGSNNDIELAKELAKLCFLGYIELSHRRDKQQYSPNELDELVNINIEAARSNCYNDCFPTSSQKKYFNELVELCRDEDTTGQHQAEGDGEKEEFDHAASPPR